MDPETQLGPLTTQKRLNEVEALVEKQNKKVLKFYWEEKDHQVLTKVFIMSQLFLIM